ncbi:hypothetical protein GGS23DRAFT_600232 [Durotheca rogersii]|uniref:uncharacterized protein n=1 Tax=Durotheca rogersii TaxID=419775 RepID=UPI00221F3EF9|nr:uncharacterized protein GGS23DRAFT_600232 [Durotheca rogersii]KAI5859531.1 hypothetical protein GGS23DRAFT_600232 [Durotheca rogersii]
MLLLYLCFWIAAIALAGDAAGRGIAPPNECPPFRNGSIVIESYQLYPENADFDLNECLLYFGSLFNASVVVYDPYKAETVLTLEFGGITRTRPFHVGGVAWDPYTNLISILVDSATPHETPDHQIAGDDYLIRYDPAKREIVWSLNITEVTRGEYGGQQDVEHDARGHVYVLGSYPGTILRVEPDGKSIKPWYLPPEIDHTVYGLTGFAAAGDILLASDIKNNSASGGSIYRFDLAAEEGVPVVVPRTPEDPILSFDAIYLPPKYGGTVLLISEHERGVSVLRSADGRWEAAEYLGLIPNDLSLVDDGGANTATVEIAGSIYTVNEWFSDPIVPGTSAGSRTKFPLVDISARVEELLVAAK